MDEERALLLQVGIHIEELQQGVHRALPRISYSNGVILALYHCAGSSHTLLRTWLYILSGIPDIKGSVDLVHKAALYKKVEKLKRDLLALSKKKVDDSTKRQEREEFLQAQFTLPSLEMTRLSAIGFVSTAACAVSSAASAVAEVAARAAITVAENAQEVRAANAQTEHVMEMSKEFATGLTKEFLAKQEILVGQLKETVEQRDNASRREARAKKAKAALQKAKATLRKETGSLRRFTKAIVEQRAADRLKQFKVRRALRSRVRQCASCPLLTSQIEEKNHHAQLLSKEISELKEALAERDDEIDKLKESLSEIESASVKAKEGKSYSPEMVECMIKLQAQGVAQAKVGPVMNTVLQCLVSKQLDALPSRWTASRCLTVGLGVARQQIAEQYPSTSATLYSDGTTKRATKMCSFAVTGSDGKEMVLGLPETIDKSSATQEQSLQNLLSDIAATSSSTNKLQAMVAAIKNVMSDRASTQVKFNSLFESWRKECLPLARQDWDRLSLSEREELCKVNSFFCNLHLLANLAGRVLECFALSESARSRFDLQVASESCAVVVLLRDVAKHFSERSAASSGIYSNWQIFIGMRREKVPSIPSFLGHRFNILFLIAARVFQIRELLILFCSEHVFDTPDVSNLALRLRDPFIINQLKVLGLLDKLVTGPLWRLSESNIHILDMGGEFQKLITWLGANASDPSEFFHGSGPNFNVPFVHDACLDSLIAEQDLSVDQQLLAKQVMLTAQKYFTATVKEFLDEGKFSHPEDLSLRADTQSVLKTNRIPESIFGLADYLFNRAPNMTMLARETLVLLIKNKPFDWLDKLPANKKQEYLDNAKTLSPMIRRQYFQRKQFMLTEQRAKLREAKSAADHRKMNTIRTRSDLTKQVMAYGLWTNEIEVDNGLRDLTTEAAKITAVQVQLRFRRLVLKQPADRTLFQFQVQQHKLSLSELLVNLKKLISDAQQIVPASSDPLQILHKKINHRFEENGELRWFRGTVVQLVAGTGPTSSGSSVYNIVYDTDRSKTYANTVEDLIADRENGDFVIL